MRVDDEILNVAVDIWLLYIQPWKANTIEKDGLAAGSKLKQHKYDSSIWKPYLAANLHFYTTLPAILFK